MHYQENTIVLGTTELQCLGEIRGRIPSWVWQRPTGQFFVNWAGEKHENEGETAVPWCWHKEQLKTSSAIRRYWHNLRPNVEELRSLRCKQRQRAKLWHSHVGIGPFRSVVTDKCCILWYGGECTVHVKYVPTEQSFLNDSSHCRVIVKNKIKYIFKKKNSVWLSNIINKDFGCRWIWNYNDPRWEVISTSDSRPRSILLLTSGHYNFISTSTKVHNLYNNNNQSCDL